jgi:hypothetical protein
MSTYRVLLGTALPLLRCFSLPGRFPACALNFTQKRPGAFPVKGARPDLTSRNGDPFVISQPAFNTNKPHEHWSD